MVKRLVWSGLLAGTGALASIVANRMAVADLAPDLRRGAARVSDPYPPPERRQASRPQNIAAAIADVSERGDAARARRDRAGQGRGHREGDAAGARRDRRRRRRRVLPDGADPRAGRLRVAALLLPARRRLHLLLGLLRDGRDPGRARRARRVDRRAAVKRGAPPTPDMAIEEARKIRETVSTPRAADAAGAGPPAPPEPAGHDGAAGPASPGGA